MTKRIIFVILSLLVFLSSQSQDLSAENQHLSVKDRWNIKLGYTLYKTFISAPKLFYFKSDDWGDTYKRKSNVRLELNYGILKWLEVGGYIGFMNYEYLTLEIWEANEDYHPNYPDAFALTFGISANIQILPLFKKKPNCKWDFYIPVRYGGCYMSKWGGKYLANWSYLPLWDNAMYDHKKGTYKTGEPTDYNKYRHEYGAGLGTAYYIKNIIGFYAEIMGGQFSYWPELVKSPYNIRVGLAAKF